MNFPKLYSQVFKPYCILLVSCKLRRYKDNSKNGAPKNVSSVPLVLLLDVAARGVVCANILGIAMKPTTNATVVTVDIPILNMHKTLLVGLINT